MEKMKSLIKLNHRKVFFFLLLIPISLLVQEVREAHIDTRESQESLFLLNAQRAYNQRAIMGIQVRILHYVEGHNEEEPFGTCPLCFKNMLLEKYDHELIRKFLRENGIDAQSYFDGELSEEELSFISSSSVTQKSTKEKLSQ
jgi:hypothetical protein|tara:strand:- start:76 stop:504 length:429 start_codon:yes stop_codon:yes gene_type:complete